MRRRDFLTAATTATATTAALGCGRKGGANPEPSGEAPAPAAPPMQPMQTAIAGAETVMGVTYTDAERAQIANSLEEQLDHVRKRRDIQLPFELAPALVFDPVLKGDLGRVVRSGVRASTPSTKAPVDDDAIAFASVVELATWLRGGALTSTRLTELYLARLEKHAGTLNCVATLMKDEALAAAREADREIAAGKTRGMLHGIPYGAKDLFDTAGVSTGWGATPFQDRVAKRDAVVIERLRAAGAILCAKLSLGALAYGDLWYGGRTRNPWNPAEGSSGSSAGSASATAAGLVGFALGTETLGSIVSPSMRCGTTGLRPTFGRVARTGAMPLCWSMDKIGPITRTVEDAAHVLAVINGADDRDPSSVTRPFGFHAGAGARGRTVGVVPSWMEDDGANELDRRALDALRQTGATIVELEAPDLPFDALVPILMAEAAATFENLTLSNRDDQLAWQDDEAWPNSFRTARLLSAVDLVQADRLRRRAMQVLHDLMEPVDAILAPSFSPLLTATNFTGHPSLTLRAGFVNRKPIREGSFTEADESAPEFRAPYGVTLWGRLFAEDTLCELGEALERELGVWRERPALT